MLTVRRLLLVLAACVALGLVAPAVHADTVILGGTGQQNRFPFGTDPIIPPTYAAGATYQQIHARTAFGAGPITITQIAFASSIPVVGTGSPGGPGTVNVNFNLRLGTAATSLAAPSATYSTNRGADLTTVFSGAISAMMTRTNTFDFIINLTTPFTYNPGNGDLLLDVVINTPTTFSNGSLYFLSGTAADTVRIFNANPSATGTVDRSNTLRTRFEFTPGGVVVIPEPAAIVLLGTGLAGVGAIVRKRRKANKG